MAIENADQFDDTPSGWAQRWAMEFEAARKECESWHKKGDSAIERYKDERKGETETFTRLNLYHGDIETKRALLYGNPPKVRVRRRFGDPNDDVARVSAEMQERLLNTDLERDEDGFKTAIGYARDDRLIPGLGVVRLRYVVEWEEVPEIPAQTGPCPHCGGSGMRGGGMEAAMACPMCQGAGMMELAPAVPATRRKSREDVETDYCQWKDFLWSPCRFWPEVRWVAFRAEMTRAGLVKRFGDVGNRVPLNAKEGRDEDEDPWARAAVWEVWSKENRRVYWYVEGYTECLDTKEDPLGLIGFWPLPAPLFANPTTAKLIPTPDLHLAKDIYDEIDNLYARIGMLTDAVRVTGGYDGASPEIAQIIDAKGGNKLYPVKNWGAFTERGGVGGGVQFLPLTEIVGAIQVLTEKLRERIMLKDQVTGIADVMRGASTGPATATEQRIKARFGSTRVQAAQDEFARFVTEAQRIRAEIIAKHFDAATIIERSNIHRTADRALAMKAAELMKDEFGQYRIEIASDSLGMTDFDSIQAERGQAVETLAKLLQSAAPMVQLGGPPAIQFVLEVASWMLSALKGGGQLEGMLDRFKAQAQQAAKGPPKPDPKLQAAQAKGQMDLAKEGVKLKADLTRIGAETQAAIAVENAQAAAGVAEARARQQMADVRPIRPGEVPI